MPRAKTDPSTHCKPQQVSMPPALLERIIKYCQAEERSISWVVQKAVDVWLKERGFLTPLFVFLRSLMYS